jgi:hypothetical protein
MLVCDSSNTTSGRGVTANMHDLGSCDSGFESQRPDKNEIFGGRVRPVDARLGFEACLSIFLSGLSRKENPNRILVL